MDQLYNLPENEPWEARIKTLEAKAASTFFGNVCVTNTNCEQQIPPKAGFCFIYLLPQIHLSGAL
jgi:hypothetical protein